MSKLQQTLIPIKLEQSNERLTSMAGLVLVEELARGHGLWQRVNELFPAPGSGRGHRASEFVRPLVCMLHAGGRHLEDVRKKREKAGSGLRLCDSFISVIPNRANCKSRASTVYVG